MHKQFMTAAEVAETMGVSLGKAYELIRGMNMPAILTSAHWNGCLGYILMRLRYIQPMKLRDFGIRSKAKIRKSLYHFLENRCHQSRRANGRIIESVWM